MKVLANTSGMSEAEWLELRKSFIGGSDASVILGVNKYKSPTALFLEKTGQVENTFKGSIATEIGNELEDYVARKFTQETGKKVRRMNKMLQHDDHEFMTANLDRVIVGEKAFLECKTTSAYNESKWKGDSVPVEYLAQVMHYLAVTGFERAYIAVIIGNHEFNYKVIERDEELISMIIEKEKDFYYNNLKANVLPEIDGSDSTTEYLNNLYNEPTDEILSLGSDVDDLILKIDTLKEAQKLDNQEQKRLENLLREKLGNHTIAESTLYVVSNKTVTTNRVDTRLLRKEKPELVEKYTKTSEYKKLIYKGVK